MPPFGKLTGLQCFRMLREPSNLGFDSMDVDSGKDSETLHKRVTNLP